MCRRAQGLIEYVLLLALIVVACVGAVRLLGQRVNDEATEISELIPGE